MKYNVHITKAAERDAGDAASYIFYSLKNPEAAATLLSEIDMTANDLDHMPERYPLVSDCVLASWGIRSVLVKNYLMFYIVSSETATVHIIRILYKKRDWAAILHKNCLPET